MAALRVVLQEEDIIVWATFWRHISNLMMGNTSLEELTSSTTNADAGRLRSDSELARELQAQFDVPSEV